MNDTKDNTIKRLEVSNLDAETLLDVLNNMQKSINEIQEKINPATDKKLTRKQVAKIFDISTTTVWAWQKSGILNPIKVGNRVYFSESDINELLERKTKK